jgi:hypothetical protein
LEFNDLIHGVDAVLILLMLYVADELGRDCEAAQLFSKRTPSCLPFSRNAVTDRAVLPSRRLFPLFETALYSVLVKHSQVPYQAFLDTKVNIAAGYARLK